MLTLVVENLWRQCI